MARWTCPQCEREFDRARQSHVCVPGCTVDDTFRGREWQRPIYAEILRALGDDVHVDAVRVGVFLKRQRKLAELRPMARALSVNLWLPRVLTDPRVVRRYDTWHVIRLTAVEQVDDQVRNWLAEAYDAAG